jgi:4-amino-4-deoxy-L-arabinose transferase-like glycosyltransferase
MTAKHGLKFCLLYFAVFSAAFTFIVPAFEAPDEAGHVSYINFLQKHKSLPNQLLDSLKEPLQGHQPPLYYSIMYSINYVFNSDSPIEYKLTPNPLHVWNGGKNQHVPVYQHTLNTNKQDNFFYVLRLLSTICGLINLFFIYKISLLVFKDQKLSLLPVIFAATLPQFAFISGVINNDNLVNLFSTMSIYFLLKTFAEPGNLKYYILTGLVIGLGIITKKTIYFIFPVLFIVLIIQLFSKNTPGKKKLITGFLFMAFVMLLICSTYIIHNIITYNEILGLREEYSTFGVFESHSLFSHYFIDPFSHEFFKSFIGYPGLMNVLLPKVIYVFYGVVLFAGFLMVLIKFKKALQENRGKIILILSIISCLAGVIYFNTLLSQFQGRFMFPVISAIAVMLAAGLKQIYTYFEKSKFSSLLTYGLIFAFVIADIISIIVTYNFYFSPSQYRM